MKHMNLCKTLGATAVIGATIITTNALAAPPQCAHGQGYGMMGGYGAVADLNLSTEQRGKITKIQNDIRRRHWELMGKMHDEQSQMNELYYANNRDDAALSKSYRKMSEMRHQMFDSSLDAQRQIDAVLTKEQREKQKRG